MPKNLLIVESPAKAKTIEKILGKDFIVKSSYGHVRDLVKDSKDTKAIDVENGYKLTYEVSGNKQKVVNELKSQSSKVDEVWLATDEDREGEAISWHLAQVLDLDVEKTKRIVFREITKPALKQAIQKPRRIDIDMVNAQQARRVLDRLVGFELSSLLWRKIKSKLSAGRVQSVAVKLIVEREREIQAHVPDAYYRVRGNLTTQNDDKFDIQASLGKRIQDLDAVRDFLANCKQAIFTVKEIKVRPTKRKPAAPFTTSTLQQEASRKLGFSVSRTMSTAQRLYEDGKITYMRTDSTRLSPVAVKNIAQIIEQTYGKRYVQTRQFKSKKANIQEAHEAIRPTYIEKQQVSGDFDQQRLYELIWKRTVASQMAEAEVENTTVDISISTEPDHRLVAKGQVLTFDGFLKVYLESTDEEEEESDVVKGLLPPLEVGQELDLEDLTATERFTRSAPRYTEAALVKKLEELGIGRPSTYAPIISKITEPSRGYILNESRDGTERSYRILTLRGDSIEEKTDTEITGAEKNKLFATDIGMVVSDFLSEHFEGVMAYDFTAEIEDKLDEISMGKDDWVAMIDEFYRPFHEKVERTMEEAERAVGERIVGKDPETGRTVLVRLNKNGDSMVQVGAPDELEEGEKPRYANLRPHQKLETITFEEVLELLQFPLDLGKYEGETILLREGPYGPYVSYGDTNISLEKGEDPMSVDFERAVELIEAKKKADAPITHYKEKPITKGIGRFGPYVKWNGMYASITKSSGYDFDTINAEEALDLVKAKEKKEAERIINRWEDKGVTLEQGRWGPLIRVGRKKKNLPKKEDGKRYTREEALEFEWEDVERFINEMNLELPKSKKKAKKTKKKGKKAKK